MDQSRKRLFPKGRVLVLGMVLSMLMLVGANLAAPVLPRGSRTANVAYAQGPSVTVISAKLLARSVVVVTVTFTCTIPDNNFQFGFVGVGQLRQASGRQIITGSATTSFTTCNSGTPTSLQITVGSALPSAPYHGGPAFVQANLFVQALDGTTQEAGNGNQVIRIMG